MAVAGSSGGNERSGFIIRTMDSDSFGELKTYIGFDQADAANLRALAEPVQPLIPRVVDRFYEVLLRHSEARAVLTGGTEQVRRLHQTLSRWLTELFEGRYDDHYYRSRFRVGQVHVRVGLPQRYMPLAMEVVWSELQRSLQGRSIPDLTGKLESLHKLLLLDLTIMSESYKESYSDQIREFERHAMEGKLARAQHLAEIGQLAASLAHEIKNPLAGISGAIQVIGDSLAQSSPFKSVIRDILRQISRLDATVKDLLVYARPTPPAPKEFAMAELLQRVNTVLREEPAMRNVELRYHGVDMGTTMYADEGQIEQLLLNLILNAAHASSDGAMIEVETVRKGPWLSLVVKDRGAGMAPQVQAKALEPFFTTKAKGTGLGLAICRRIAEAHGGTILLQSELGKGTTVIVELPAGIKPRDTENNPCSRVS